MPQMYSKKGKLKHQQWICVFFVLFFFLWKRKWNCASWAFWPTLLFPYSKSKDYWKTIVTQLVATGMTKVLTHLHKKKRKREMCQLCDSAWHAAILVCKCIISGGDIWPFFPPPWDYLSLNFNLASLASWVERVSWRHEPSPPPTRCTQRPHSHQVTL